jgi:hypothetical protein
MPKAKLEISMSVAGYVVPDVSPEAPGRGGEESC